MTNKTILDAVHETVKGLRKAELRGDLTFIGVRHEGAAAFAASAV